MVRVSHCVFLYLGSKENPTAPAEEEDEAPQSAIPSGFFDNNEADAKARGIDLEAEMK